MAEGRLTFCVLLVLFFGAQSATVIFKNQCPDTVWPAAQTGAGSQLPSTGFKLALDESKTISVSAPWSGRFWARTQCADANGTFQCATADCGSGEIQCNGAGPNPPVNVIELFLAENNGQDSYDVNLVDGFNLPVSITPLGVSAGCNATSCPADVNAVCPPELQVNGSDGGVIGCKSACLAFNQPRYCCSGEFRSPETCPPTQYSRIFKSQCPDAYSYAYDNATSTFTCAGGANYLIIFCP